MYASKMQCIYNKVKEINKFGITRINLKSRNLYIKLEIYIIM